MATYDPKLVGSYIEQMSESGQTATEMAEELGVLPGTLASAVRRFKERTKKEKKKPGPKPKVTVVDLAQPVSKAKSIPQLLSEIETNVVMIRKILGG